MAAAALMAAAAGATAAGKLLQGAMAYSSNNYNARVQEAQGQQARMDAGIQSQLILDQGARETAKGITAAAQSGGGFGGSARGVLEDLGRQNLYQARQAANEGLAAARAANAQAQESRRAGRVAFVGAGVDAVSTLLSGAMGQYQQGQLLKAVAGA